jgi:hypothetical protein
VGSASGDIVGGGSYNPPGHGILAPSLNRMLTLVPLAAVHQLNLEQMLRLVDTHTAPAEGYEYEHGWLAAPPGINTPDFVERVQLADPGPEPQSPDVDADM